MLRGRRLLTGDAATRAFLKSAKPEIEQSGAGLELIPGLAVSRDRESRHWLIWGSVGAGKTQTMLHLILAAIARGDSVLVLDVKGDMTAGLPAGAAEELGKRIPLGRLGTPDDVAGVVRFLASPAASCSVSTWRFRSWRSPACRTSARNTSGSASLVRKW